jgi:hypothetical protein
VCTRFSWRIIMSGGELVWIRQWIIGSINTWTSWWANRMLAFQVWLYCGIGCPCFSGSTGYFEDNASRSLSNAAYKHWVPCSVGHTFKLLWPTFQTIDYHFTFYMSLRLEVCPVCYTVLVSSFQSRSHWLRGVSLLEFWVPGFGSQCGHACRHSYLTQ